MSAYESTNQLIHANIIITLSAMQKESHVVFLDAIPVRCTNLIIFLCRSLLTLYHHVTRLNTFKIIKTLKLQLCHTLTAATIEGL